MQLKVPTTSSARFEYLCASIVILCFVVLGALSVQRLSLTADKSDHYKYGLKILSLNSTRLGGDDSKMPITALNALPAKLASRLPTGSARSMLEQFFVARLVTILFSSFIALFVFHWARSLYGFPGGMAALILYVLDPNIIAHSQLVTTDIYSAGMTLLACYWLWKFANSRRYIHGVICLLALGLALISKYVALALLPLFVLMLGLHDWRAQPASRASSGPAAGRLARNLLIYAAVAIVSSLVAINLGFLFNRTLMPFKDYRFQSPMLQFLRRDVGFLAHLPTPVPYPFLKGLDRVMYREHTGIGYGKIYLLGHLKVAEGFKGYYFVASLLKVPLASQLVVLGSLVVYFARKQRRSSFFSNELFMLVPVVFFSIYFNFFYNAQIGIRFYLLIFPLLYVFAGGLLKNWSGISIGSRVGIFVLAAYLVGSVASYYPQYLAYFNEIVWDRKTAYKYLANSNLNWGQGQNYLKDYMAAHPEAVFEPDRVRSGLLVVLPDELVGVTVDPGKFAWLRDNFQPVDTVDYIYLVYKISPLEIEQLCRTRSICP